jgi:predicted nucleic acid-binding protein
LTGERAYFDSGVFLTPVLKNQPEDVIDQCISWQERIARGETLGVTCYLTWDEVTYVVRKTVGADEAAEVGDRFLNLPGLRFVEVESETIYLAQQFLSKFNVKPRDSIHASSAILHGGSKIVTVDVSRSDFRKLLDDEGQPLLSIEELSLRT